MIIVADYSYRKGEILYGVASIEDINKIKDFLKKNRLTVAHIKELSKKQKINIKIKWRKFSKNANNLLLLKETTNYKFFENENELINYLKSLDNHIRINFNYAKIIYESSVYVTRKD